MSATSEHFTNSIANCERFNSLLKDAKAAVEQLSLCGCVPRKIELGGDRPVIVIDPPTNAPFIRGAMRLRERAGRVTRTVMATPFHGCRLEWEETLFNPKPRLQ